jgi:hypothetical protein
VANSDRVEALVAEIVGHRFPYGSSRQLHLTLGIAAGVTANDSVRLPTRPPALRPVIWPRLVGNVRCAI